MSDSKRDPRTDPVGGDVLRVVDLDGDAFTLSVTGVTPDGVTFVSAAVDGHASFTNTPSEWRDWSEFVTVDVLWPCLGGAR